MNWLDSLSQRYQDYSRPPEAPHSMVTNNELCFIETFAHEGFQDKGELYDLGCWYGATTVALARGMSQNKNINSKRKIQAFDLFIWQSWMDNRGLESLPDYKPGDSFYEDVVKLLSTYRQFIDLYRKDLLMFHPPSIPIELLFVDAMKSWSLADVLSHRFFPLLIPDKSIVVMQDFVWFGGIIPSNTLLMWYLRDYFEAVHHVPNSCSVAFRCTKKINASILSEIKPSLFSLDDIHKAYSHSFTFVVSNMHQHLVASKLIYLMERGDVDDAFSTWIELKPFVNKLPTDFSMKVSGYLSNTCQKESSTKTVELCKEIISFLNHE